MSLNFEGVRVELESDIRKLRKEAETAAELVKHCEIIEEHITDRAKVGRLKVRRMRDEVVELNERIYKLEDDVREKEREEAAELNKLRLQNAVLARLPQKTKLERKTSAHLRAIQERSQNTHAQIAELKIVLEDLDRRITSLKETQNAEIAKEWDEVEAQKRKYWAIEQDKREELAELEAILAECRKMAAAEDMRDDYVIYAEKHDIDWDDDDELFYKCNRHFYFAIGGTEESVADFEKSFRNLEVFNIRLEL